MTDNMNSLRYRQDDRARTATDRFKENVDSRLKQPNTDCRTGIAANYEFKLFSQLYRKLSLIERACF